MIIFLHGSDGYRLKKRSREIIDSYQKKHKSGLNFFKFDCADMGAGEFIKIEEAIKNSSFFNEIKLVVLNSPFSQKIIADKIGDFIKKYDLLKTKDVVVLAVENSDDKPSLTGNKGLLELLKKPGNLVENINYMGGVKLTNWIKNEFVSRDCAIEPMALRKIIDLLITPKTDLNIFDLVDAIASKNKIKAFDILYRELKTGRNANYILTMIIFQFRNLLMIKDLALRSTPPDLMAKKSGLHPFVVKKAMRELGKYEMSELKSFYGKLLNADIA